MREERAGDVGEEIKKYFFHLKNIVILKKAVSLQQQFPPRLFTMRTTAGLRDL